MCLHPTKNVVFPVRQGIAFLGYRVLPTHRLLAKANVWGFRRRLWKLQNRYAGYEITRAEVIQRILNWSGHARQADTYALRRQLFQEHPLRRTTTVKPGVARRLVQQSSGERVPRQS